MPFTTVPASVSAVKEDPEIAPPAILLPVMKPTTDRTLTPIVTVVEQVLPLQVMVTVVGRVGRDPRTAEKPDVVSGAVSTEFPVSVTVVVPPESA